MDQEQLEQGAQGASEVDPAVEAKARSMGWSPREKWRGDPAQWVDAAEFVERGERILPILKATNHQLEQKTVALETANRELSSQIEELRGSMDEFVTAQREMLKDRLAQQRAEIRKQLREAREAGDDDAIDRLEQSLDTNDEQRKKLEEAKPPEKKGTPPPPPDPIYEAWQSRNPWFGGKSREDQRKTALAMQFGREAVQAKLQGDDFFNYIDEEMSKVATADGPRAAGSKTENGRPSGAPSAGGSAFNKLPPEAQAQAKRDAARFVGPNKVFKTEAEWFNHFAKLYGE